MTATIELTGEVVRPGDSGYEAAPADAGQEESDFAGSRARHRGQRDRPRRRISSVLLALLGPVALGVEAAPLSPRGSGPPQSYQLLASVAGAMMRRRSSSNDSSVDTCDKGRWRWSGTVRIPESGCSVPEPFQSTPIHAGIMAHQVGNMDPWMPV